jgi:hypothetical protein
MVKNTSKSKNLLFAGEVSRKSRAKPVFSEGKPREPRAGERLSSAVAFGEEDR